MSINKICTEIKSLLARKIEYINRNRDKDNILALVDKSNAPETIFIYYYPSNSQDSLSIDKYGYNKYRDNLYEYGNDIIKSYFDKTERQSQEINFDFIFNIYPKNKNIYTRIENVGYKKGKSFDIPDIYTSTDMKKILSDLLKNNIITSDYKLNIEGNKYLVNDILTKKNTPIKQSNRGNLVLFHGTSIDNWKSIKKHGGLNPNYGGSTRTDYGYIEGITDKSIYLTSSFNIAKSYATSYGEYSEPIILMVEVPDMSKLMPDDDYMSYEIREAIVKIIDNKKTENKDLLNIRKFVNHNEYGTGIAVNGVQVSWEAIFEKSKLFLQAILEKDFSIVSDNILSIEVGAYKLVYNYLYKIYGQYFHTISAIRNSLNSNHTSNGVAYRGRIPLSYILGAYDINGNKIE